MANFEKNELLKQQETLMNRTELDALQYCIRTIRFDTEYGNPHPLDGFGQQGILQGAYAVDFTPGNDNRGRWRLIYDNLGDGNIRLHGIIDYHGGGRYAAAWGVGYNIDLSD